MENEQFDLGEPRANMSRHVRSELPKHDDINGVWMTVNEAVAYCASQGLVRTNKTVRRWAHRSIAHPEAAEVIAQRQDTETDFRYIIERSSLDVKIQQELRFEAQTKTADNAEQVQSGSDTCAHEPASSSPNKYENALANTVADVQTGADKPEQVSTSDTETSSSDLFYTQINEKDRQINNLYKQLERRDEQIMAMLERDRETNILIKGLQEALLPGVEDISASSEKRRLDVRSESFVDDQTINTPEQAGEQADDNGVYYKI